MSMVDGTKGYIEMKKAFDEMKKAFDRMEKVFDEMEKPPEEVEKPPEEVEKPPKKTKAYKVSWSDFVYGLLVVTLGSGSLSIWLAGRASPAPDLWSFFWVHRKQLALSLAILFGAALLLYCLGQWLQKRFQTMSLYPYARQIDWVPFWLGIVERSLIMIGLAAGGKFDSAVLSAAGGWIALKAIHGWQLSIGTKEAASPEKTAASLLALLLSVVSAAFGAAAGFALR